MKGQEVGSCNKWLQRAMPLVLALVAVVHGASEAVASPKMPKVVAVAALGANLKVSLEWRQSGKSETDGTLVMVVTGDGEKTFVLDDGMPAEGVWGPVEPVNKNNLLFETGTPTEYGEGYQFVQKGDTIVWMTAPNLQEKAKWKVRSTFKLAKGARVQAVRAGQR